MLTPFPTHHWATVAGLLTVSLLAAGAPSPAQPSPSTPLQEWERDWTVLTMAPDGAWGVGTDSWTIGALTAATSDCKAMSGRELGCGAHFTAIRAGWIFGIRCGDKNIIVAEEELKDVEFSAGWREHELRMLHYPDMPPCRRVVTVTAEGEILLPARKDASYPSQ